MEERMVGRKNGGADGWASFGIHGGAPEGRWIDLYSILQLKKVIFVVEALIDAQGSAPRLPPLHKMNPKFVKDETRSSTTMKNHCFWIKTYLLKLMERLLYDFQLF